MHGLDPLEVILCEINRHDRITVAELVEATGYSATTCRKAALELCGFGTVGYDLITTHHKADPASLRSGTLTRKTYSFYPISR